MQPYAINISPVAASEFPAAVDAAIAAQDASLSDEVKGILGHLGDATKSLAAELIVEGTHIGAYIAGVHASGTENTGLREQHGIQLYAAPAPPPPADVDSVTQAPAAEPGGLFASTGGSPVSESTPAAGGTMGANPIPTALEPANTVPDGSEPTPPGTVPAAAVDPNAPADAPPFGTPEPEPAEVAETTPDAVVDPSAAPAAPAPEAETPGEATAADEHTEPAV